MPKKWEKLFKNGHAYFMRVDGDGKDERIYVADESGPTPDQTDDGILYIDTTRNIVAKNDFISLPLIDKNGGQTRTCMGVAEMLEVALRCGMFIDTPAGLMRVERQG